MVAPLKCCGKEWTWKDVGFLEMDVTKDKLAFCALCGNFKRRTEGQLDEEEVGGWLGISDKKIKELTLLDENINKLTEKYRETLVDFYKSN